MVETNSAAVTAPSATEQVQTPAKAPADAGSSLQSTSSDLSSRVRDANSPAAIRALIQQEKNRPVSSPPPAPAKQEAVAPVEPAPAAPEAKATDNANEAAPETATTDGESAVESDSEAETEGDEGGGENPVEIPTAKQLRIRLPQDDKIGRRAAAIMQRNRDMGMEQAIGLAREQLGIKTQPDTPPAPEAASATPAVSAMPKSIEEVDAAIKQLRVERRKANTELRFEEATDYSEKLEDLIQHRGNLERESDKRKTEEVANYHREFALSSKKASELYAFASEPESPGGKLMRQFEDALQETGDPRYHSPDKPLLCAQWAAQELNVPPRRKGVQTTPAKAAAPVAPPKPKQILPSGASRTTPPAVNAQPAINEDIGKLRTGPEVKKFLRTFGVR